MINRGDEGDGETGRRGKGGSYYYRQAPCAGAVRVAEALVPPPLSAVGVIGRGAFGVGMEGGTNIVRRRWFLFVARTST